MRIDYRYGAAVGILAAAFATLGPVAAQAGQTPGAFSVPTCAGACGLEAPAVHITGIASRSIALTSTVERSSYNYGYDREKFAFLGHRDRVVVKSDRCKEEWWGKGWHRDCKSCHFGEVKDVNLIKPLPFKPFPIVKPINVIKPILPIKTHKHFNHIKHFKHIKHFSNLGNFRYGDLGHHGHVTLTSHDSGLR